MSTTGDLSPDHSTCEIASGECEAHPALENVYSSLAPEVLVWVRARAGSRLRASRDIEDIAQDVWLRVAHSLSRYDASRGSVRKWVHRITEHTVLDLLRAVRAAPLSLDEPEVLLALPAVDLLSAERTEWRELSPRLRARCAALAPLDRRLLAICGPEGRPTTAAARELGLTTEAARKRWLRLRRRLALGACASRGGE